MSMKMFRKFSCLALAALAFLSVNAAEDYGALLWMVSGDSTVNRFGTIYTIEEFNAATSFKHGQIESARIAATPTAGGDVVYLYMYDGTTPDPYWDSIDLEFDTPGKEDVTWASFAALDGDPADYSFAIELGYWTEDWTIWNIEALSDKQAYADLQNFISSSVIATPGYDPWNPGAYTIPEPSAGLMLLIGFGFLSLRRKEVRK